MSSQINLTSHPEAGDPPSTTPMANKDHSAPESALAHCSNTKKARSRAHNPTKSLNVPQSGVEKASGSRHRARTVSHAHPSHSPRDPSDTPLVPNDSPTVHLRAALKCQVPAQPQLSPITSHDESGTTGLDNPPTIQLRAALKCQVPAHPQLSPIVSLVESKTTGLWEIPRDPAIIYAGTKGPGVKEHETSPARTQRDKERANAERFDRNSIIEELLAKLKEFAPHIDEASQRMGVDGGANKLTGNLEELNQSWEDAKQNGLRYIDGSPVREYDTQLITAPTGKGTGQTKSGSLDTVENPSSSFIKVSVLLEDMKHPGKQIEWPIYLKSTPLSHDAFWVDVDFPCGFPFPPVSSDGTFRVKIKNREEFPIGVWPDGTLLLGIDEPCYRFRDSYASLACIRYSSISSATDDERQPRALITVSESYNRVEGFPLAHLLNDKAALHAKSEAPNHKYQRRETHSCPAPPSIQNPDASQRSDSRCSSSLSSHYLQIDTGHHQEKSSLLLAPTPSPVPGIKYVDASTQVNMPFGHRGIPSQIRYSKAKPQVEIPIHPWKVLVPLPSHRGQLPGIPMSEPPTGLPDESQHVNSGSSTGDNLGFKNSQAYETILGILNQGKKDGLETSRRIGSDGIRALADKIWSSPEGKKFNSREEILSELKTKPISPETYRMTMQRYISRNMPKDRSHEIGGSNWRKPAPLLNRRHRPDVRNVFPDVYEDCTATSGPSHKFPHNRQSNNNANPQLPDHSESRSVEEQDIFEHVQTLREKGNLERLWRLKEALERTLTDEKENLVPIRQPLQPIPGAKGFRDRASLKRSGFQRASNTLAPSRTSRDVRRSQNRTDDSNSTVVRREPRGNGQSNCETLVEREQFETYDDNLGSWEEPPELPPAYTNSQDPIPFITPAIYGGPLYVHDSLRHTGPSVPLLPIPSYSEPVYFHNPHHSYRIPYPQTANIPFDKGPLSSYYQPPEPSTMTPPVVDGQSLRQLHPGVNVPFSVFQSMIPPATSYSQPGNYFAASVPQPDPWMPIENQYNPIRPPQYYPGVSSSYAESGTHTLCHRLRKEKAEEILERFKADYPVTGKNLFKENIRHQHSLRMSKGKTKGKDAAAIQQDLEMKLMQKKEMMIREMARGRKNGVAVSVTIRKPDGGGNEVLDGW